MAANLLPVSGLTTALTEGRNLFAEQTSVTYFNPQLRYYYTVSRRTSGSTFIIITLENLDRFL